MQTQKFVLILGFIFSFVIAVFTVDNGFSFSGIEWQITLYQFNLFGNADSPATSILLAYICFFIFILDFSRGSSKGLRPYVISFFILAGLGLAIESLSLIESMTGHHSGRHFNCGKLLAVLGYYMIRKQQKQEKPATS